MIKFLYTIVFICNFWLTALAQDSMPPDTSKKKRVERTSLEKKASEESIDSLDKKLANDSSRKDTVNPLEKAIIKPTISKIDTSTYQQYYPSNYYPFFQAYQSLIMQPRIVSYRTDAIFISLFIIFFAIALMRYFNKKYFDNLFVLFSQTAFRQNQTREQMQQDKLSSLAMNIVFVASSSLLLSVISNKNSDAATGTIFFKLFLFYATIVVTIYVVKYILLNLIGYVFEIKEATQSYLFMVFLLNKIIGVVLLPLIGLMAFSSPDIKKVVVTLSFFVLGIFILYRLIVGISLLRNAVKINAVHFLLYICAAEVIPILVIYKVYQSYIIQILN